MNILRNLGLTVDGLAKIIVRAPKQGWAIYSMLSPEDKKKVQEILGIKDKMDAMGEFQQSALKKASPYIVAGIVGIIAFNVYKEGK